MERCPAFDVRNIDKCFCMFSSEKKEVVSFTFSICFLRCEQTKNCHCVYACLHAQHLIQYVCNSCCHDVIYGLMLVKRSTRDNYRSGMGSPSSITHVQLHTVGT